MIAKDVKIKIGKTKYLLEYVDVKHEPRPFYRLWRNTEIFLCNRYQLKDAIDYVLDDAKERENV